MTLSQQLSWSHFVELLPIQDDLKREFYATLCVNEGWSVREKGEMRPGENKPIALILCVDKPEEAVKLMGLDEGDIRVAQYLTKMPPKEEFEKRLALAIANAKKSLDGK